MADSQGVLIAISLFVVMVIVSIAFEKRKTSNLGEIGSFIGGITSPIVLVWIIYAQFNQTESINLKQKILENDVRGITPYLSVFIDERSYEKKISAIDFYNEENKLPNLNTLPTKNDVVSSIQTDIKNNIILEVEKITLELKKLNQEFIEAKYNEKYPFPHGFQELTLTLINSGSTLHNLKIEENENLKTIQITNKIEKEKTAKIKLKIPYDYFIEEEKLNLTSHLIGIDNFGKKRKYKIEISINKKTEGIKSIHSLLKSINLGIKSFSNKKLIEYITDDQFLSFQKIITPHLTSKITEIENAY